MFYKQDIGPELLGCGKQLFYYTPSEQECRRMYTKD